MTFRIEMFIKQKDQDVLEFKDQFDQVKSHLENYYCELCGSEFNRYKQAKEHFEKMHPDFGDNYRRRMRQDGAQRKLSSMRKWSKKRADLKSLRRLEEFREDLDKEIASLKEQLKVRKYKGKDKYKSRITEVKGKAKKALEKFEALA